MNTNIELNMHMEINEGKWVKDSKNRDVFLMPSKLEDTKFHESTNFEIYSKVEWNNEVYQAIILLEKFNNQFTEAIFRFLSSMEQSFNHSISLIENFINASDFLTIEIIRGIFAEINFLKEQPNATIPLENSIYDFVLNDLDVDIKSYSKVKKEIKVSFQQLTNSKVGKIFAYEVFESNEGQSLLEAYSQMTNSLKRYSWINSSKSKLINKKFKISSPIIINLSEMKEGLVMPRKAKNANFTFSVESWE